jgi:hypothetical protein
MSLWNLFFEQQLCDRNAAGLDYFFDDPLILGKCAGWGWQPTGHAAG